MAQVKDREKVAVNQPQLNAAANAIISNMVRKDTAEGERFWTAVAERLKEIAANNGREAEVIPLTGRKDLFDPEVTAGIEHNSLDRIHAMAKQYGKRKEAREAALKSAGVKK